MHNQSDLMQQFKAWQASSDPNKGDFVEYLKTHAPWTFAHHPAHACFREHVWKINGLYLCKGCVVTYAGFVAGVLLQWLSGWLGAFSEEQLGAIFVAMLLPTLLSSTFDWPRPLRHVARFLLGVLIASALMLLFVTDHWDVRLIVIVTFVVVQRVFEKRRRAKNERILQSCGK